MLCLRRVGVALLDQEPLLLAALRLDERPACRAACGRCRSNSSLPLRSRRAVSSTGDQRAAIPDDHRARAVVALRDPALEVRVLERVILDVHREPLIGRDSATGRSARPRSAARPPSPAGSRSASRRAACFCTTNCCPPPFGAAPKGSGVRSACRLRGSVRGNLLPCGHGCLYCQSLAKQGVITHGRTSNLHCHDFVRARLHSGEALLVRESRRARSHFNQMDKKDGSRLEAAARELAQRRGRAARRDRQRLRVREGTVRPLQSRTS